MILRATIVSSYGSGCVQRCANASVLSKTTICALTTTDLVTTPPVLMPSQVGAQARRTGAMAGVDKLQRVIAPRAAQMASAPGSMDDSRSNVPASLG
jgi:hypothetical protein